MHILVPFFLKFPANASKILLKLSCLFVCLSPYVFTDVQRMKKKNKHRENSLTGRTNAVQYSTQNIVGDLAKNLNCCLSGQTDSREELIK